MFFVTGLFWSSWRSERMKRGRSQTGVSKAISSLKVVLVGYLSAVAPRRRLLPLTCLRLPPPCNQWCSCTAAIQKTSQLYFQAQSKSHIAEDTGSLFTCLPRCGDVSLLDWRSWSISWPISLKVGLSVGSRLQQRVISSYLGRQGVLKL